MNAKYIHLLLYWCKRSTAPLPVTLTNPEGNLERIDGQMLAADQPNSFDHKRGSLKMVS
jgi:hypothetical protein